MTRPVTRPVSCSAAGRPDPDDGGCDVLLRDGGIARIRPLLPSDREALHALVDRSSERSAYLRFFTGGRATAHGYMDRITGPRHPGRALVALMRDRLVGVAEYLPDPERPEAEVGILLDDEVHGHGLGTLLLEHLALDAAERGVEELVAVVLPGNGPMLRVLADLGLPATRRSEPGEIEVRIAPLRDGRLLEEVERRTHEAERNSLAHVLTPASVAVVGASRDPTRVGHRILRALVDGGFPGPIHPVNPYAAEVAGLPAHPGLGAVPGPVDLAVVAVPPAAVLGVAQDCARHGVRALVVVSSGPSGQAPLAEAGNGDSARELLRICREAGMRLVGPGSLGVVNTTASLHAAVLPVRPPAGHLGLMSQPGAAGVALVERARLLGLGVSSFVSVGDKADVSGNDLLEWWEDDPETRVVALCLESFGNPRRFARIARRISAKKPVIVVAGADALAPAAPPHNAGPTAPGPATRSHSAGTAAPGPAGCSDAAAVGALSPAEPAARPRAAAATPDVALDALLRGAGVIREDDARDLLDTARLLALQPPPAGHRVAIVGNSAGAQATIAGACERRGLLVPELSPATQRALRARLRPGAAVANPVDLTAGGDAGEYRAALEAVLADPCVDAVLAVYAPPSGSGLDATRDAVAAAASGSPVTVLACVMGHDGLIGDSVPAYAFPEQAVHALSRAVEYASRRAAPPLCDAAPPGLDARAAREIVDRDLTAHPGGRWLDVPIAAALLSCYGVRVTPSAAAGGPDAAAEPAAEAGAVEMIVGGVAHDAFGPLITTGPAGSGVVTDRAFRVPPIDRAEAVRMIGELRCRAILFGRSGRPRVCVEALEDQIVRVGRLMDDLPEIAELALDPVVVTPVGAVATGARVRLAPAAPPPSPYRRRLR
ncbi:bifunctional acetate--CoA ligase family protein/GNAT family N-acetyltransferase [Microbispora sp. ATCC PTA-5024]|uniref:bifunctional acetate--CoA ligase family protein/GNAT family N-acetyltransferase n=1 Tax=Microbispora sp. ATCC PTA-5024 TaxID=316330 RepID=UPI0006851647|nr:GNAT family N-acetyltransferase [Microbispora sp. ATCC PTA-5024]